jgi:hypothetical protein
MNGGKLTRVLHSSFTILLHSPSASQRRPASVTIAARQKNIEAIPEQVEKKGTVGSYSGV